MFNNNLYSALNAYNPTLGNPTFKMQRSFLSLNAECVCVCACVCVYTHVYVCINLNKTLAGFGWGLL